LPALIVVGGDDAYTTRGQAEQLRDAISNSTLLWLDDCGHMPNLEMEAAFNAALFQFLTGIRGDKTEETIRE
jgi:pimeloyl-ACP methyl ester carboxylesterase